MTNSKPSGKSSSDTSSDTAVGEDAYELKDKTVKVEQSPTPAPLKVKKRKGAWRNYIPFTAGGDIPPVPSSFADASILPLVDCSFFSMVTFHWITPLMKRGYLRPVQANDLWKLDESRQCHYLSEKFLEALDRRSIDDEEWNKRLKSGEYKPSFFALHIRWPLRHFFGLGTKDGYRRPGIFLALNDVFGRDYWFSAVLKLFGDATQATMPLVTKAIITFGTGAYYHHRGVPGYTEQSIGHGVGLAIGLLVMSLFSSVCMHQVNVPRDRNSFR